jgi:hypothetical protein
MQCLTLKHHHLESSVDPPLLERQEGMDVFAEETTVPQKYIYF